MAYTRNQTDLVRVSRIFRSATSEGNQSFWDGSHTESDSNSRSGSKVANWRQKIRAGEYAGSDYSVDWCKRSYSPTSAYTRMRTPRPPPQRDLVDTHYFSGSPEGLGVVSHSVGDLAAVDAKALSQVYDRLRSERSKINGYAFVGELSQTIAQLRNPFAAARSYLSRVVQNEHKTLNEIYRTRNRAQKRDKFMKMVAGTNLEINFGLKPLISDIQGIARSVADTVVRPTPRDRITGKAQSDFKTVSYEAPYRTDNNNIGYNIVNSNVHETETSIGVRYVVMVSTQAIVSQGSAERLATNFGFTTENVVPALYELTPWSWLLDYFTNVGDIIEAGTTDTSNVLWAIKTTWQKTRRTTMSYGENPGPWVVDGSRFLESWSFPPAKAEAVRMTLRRQKVSLGVPPIVFTHPGENFQRMFNMLSVAEQRRRSFRM